MKNKAGVIIIIILILAAGLWLINKSGISNNDSLLVENYFKENIRAITPEKPVLGGQWYVVIVDINESDRSGIVVYEDGHIQRSGSFRYEIKRGKVILKDFTPASPSA